MPTGADSMASPLLYRRYNIKQAVIPAARDSLRNEALTWLECRTMNVIPAPAAWALFAFLSFESTTSCSSIQDCANNLAGSSGQATSSASGMARGLRVPGRKLNMTGTPQCVNNYVNLRAAPAATYSDVFVLALVLGISFPCFAAPALAL